MLAMKIAPFLLFLLQQSHGSTVSRIPNPNVCRRKSDSVWVKWESSDCPPTAACVPVTGNNTHGYCSCSLTPEHHKLDGSNCVTSTNSKVLAVCFGLLGAGSLVLIAVATNQLVLARRRGVLQMNFMFATGACSIPTLLFLFIHMVCQVLLYTEVPASQRRAVVWVRTGVIVVEGICVFAIVLMFGLSIHDFVTHSEQLMAVNHKRSRRTILLRMAALNVVLTILVTPLAILEQWDLAVLIWGLFALICLLLYNYGLTWFMKMGGNRQPTLRPSVRVAQVNLALQGTRLLCLRLLLTIFMFITFCVVLVYAWYTGRSQKDGILLGVVYSWALLGMHASIFVGCVCTIAFLRTLVVVRSLPVITGAGTTTATPPQPRPQKRTTRVDPSMIA